MANLDVLKQRIENAERRLHSVQSARERECEALMDLWEQIRSKFREQENEIAGYRARLSALHDANAELTSMIDSMLGSIESSVSRPLDRTVPEIATMAKDLLGSEPDGTSANEQNPDPESGIDFDTLTASEISEIDVDSGEIAPSDERESLREHRWFNAPSVPLPETDAAPKDEPESIPDYDESEILELTEPLNPEPSEAGPGIRNLISRIERAVNKAAGAAGAEAERHQPSSSDQGVEEIETLRNELNGLRQRISATGPAE